MMDLNLEPFDTLELHYHRATLTSAKVLYISSENVIDMNGFIAGMCRPIPHSILVSGPLCDNLLIETR